ncbi:hypothetical protein BS50DRAFT_128260 [Corynespora cassiicola Philippines]|uniref:Uncharacterized protein n=1 Tax=Corynespora cassiicola Philippines TaxID=1448308 RepID=A0A2T2NBX6_CORCC|nr:hypothetical protein BS50DRAFT_128260 [Corynespora cassiicola Philippines]
MRHRACGNSLQGAVQACFKKLDMQLVGRHGKNLAFCRTETYEAKGEGRRWGEKIYQHRQGHAFLRQCSNTKFINRSIYLIYSSPANSSLERLCHEHYNANLNRIDVLDFSFRLHILSINFHLVSSVLNPSSLSHTARMVCTAPLLYLEFLNKKYRNCRSVIRIGFLQP